jgi:predicted transcriptional regulator
MYGIPDRLKALSAAEETVLLAVWASRPPITRREIANHLPDKQWADATLLNFLYRLEEKGWVKSGKELNRNIYTPCVTKRAYGVWCMRERLDKIFEGDVAAAVYALVSESGCTESQLQKALDVLQEKCSQAEEYDLYDPYG